MTTTRRHGQGKTALAFFVLAFGLALSGCGSDDPPKDPNRFINACLDLDQKVAEVIANCRKVLDEDITTPSQRAAAHNRLGFAALLQAEHEAAIVEFERSLALATSLASSHMGIGWAELRLYQPDRAKAAFDRALTSDPKLISAYEGRGIVHLVGQDYGAAIADLTRFLQAHPRSTRALNNRGDAYFAAGQPHSALADYDALIAIVDVAQPDLFLTRAEILAALGRRTDPARDWISALEAKGAGQVSAWQKRMQSHGGHYEGPIDGQLSPTTRRALAACMQDKVCRLVN